MDEARSRLRELLSMVRAEDYYAVASSARFRAHERRLTWQASRAAMLVIAVAAPIHVLALALLHPADAASLALVNGVLGTVALAAWWSLRHGLRHRPEPVAFVLSLAVAAACILLAVTGPEMVQLAVAYLLFLPPLVALVLPWRSWTEARWLAVYAMVGVAFFVAFPLDRRLSVVDRQDLIFALLVALAAAFTGHVLLYRQRIRGFRQVQALGRLQRHERRQRAELQRVLRALEVTARTDVLTGINNRLKLEEDLKSARGRLDRTGASIGLLEVDLDRFKGVNDAFGHLAGDDVLRRVAHTLRDTIRSDDAVYRYGGEEFLILLGDVAGGVKAAGDRVRQAVEDLAIAHPANPPFVFVTVSVGAVLITAMDSAQTNDEWFGRVDAALYQAKLHGRDRVVVGPAAHATAVEAAPQAPAPSNGRRRAVEHPV